MGYEPFVAEVFLYDLLVADEISTGQFGFDKNVSYNSVWISKQRKHFVYPRQVLERVVD